MKQKLKIPELKKDRRLSIAFEMDSLMYVINNIYGRV
jgi:hypothetical protein